MDFLVGLVVVFLVFRERVNSKNIRSLHQALSDLRRELAVIKLLHQGPAPAARMAEPEVKVAEDAPFMPPPAPAVEEMPAPAAAPLPEPAFFPDAEPIPPTVHEAPPRPTPPPPAPPPAWLVAAKGWLFSGNLVAKLGLLILFIGISFLLKYAAERVTVPIELRLAAIVVADIALLAWGWRIRETRRTIGLPVQGAALAIFMLVTFGAFRLYHLIPSGMAFGLLFVLTVFTCLLAVMQDAVWLAVFGIAGGFLAPVLTSTGQGSHVALFSYYTLLNAGIGAIALKRQWRMLNLLGFVFTFAIGTAWGVLKYEPENYLSTQLFLILFAVFFNALAIVDAARQEQHALGKVDAVLVFGTPLLGFGLQASLVHAMPFGLAYSALALGLAYVGLASALWQRGRPQFQMLARAYLALALVFGTLAVPFALDGRWTAAAWALEGAALVWYGLRQPNTLVCLFGLLVQLGAWVSFLGTAGDMGRHTALEAHLWRDFLLLSAAALFLARTIRRRREALPTAVPAWLAGVFLVIAALWFMAGAWTELLLRYDGAVLTNLMAGSALAGSVLLAFISRRMEWQLATRFAMAVLFLSSAILIVMIALDMQAYRGSAAKLLDTPLIGALIMFGGAFVSSRVLARDTARELQQFSGAMLGWSGFWWYGVVLQLLARWFEVNWPSEPVQQFQYYLISVAVSGIAFAALARKLAWPAARWLSAPAWVGLAASLAGLAVQLYGDQMPAALSWIALLSLLAAGEWLMHTWEAGESRAAVVVLKVLHTVRTAGVWILVWPTLSILVDRWLGTGSAAEKALLSDAGYATSTSWSMLIPAWLMIGVGMWVSAQARRERWPAAPFGLWYRQVLVPLGAAWSLLLALYWNVRFDGGMAPLPYLPLLNPIDLTTGFAVLFATLAWRSASDAGDSTRPNPALAKVPHMLGAFGYLWLNMMLLRTASHALDIPYRFDPLFASQAVQSMLSLAWSITAMVLMLRAARTMSRPLWVMGAAFLGLVMAKLFLIDLQNAGSVARIVSFVGVGVLMLAIGYLAPFPSNKDEAKAPAST